MLIGRIALGVTTVIALWCSAPAFADNSEQMIQATWYGKEHAGHRTANGERFDPKALTAAHRTLPFGTLVEVSTLSGRSVVVRITDRPGSNIIDLSEAAARRIGMEGTMLVKIRPLGLLAGGL